MSSILTNTSAMVALQTMKSISTNLNRTQSEISTGKSVATAKDNAAVWAISKVMESDVKGFMGISDSLSLGSSTIAVARQASETVTDLLTEIKGKIVSSQGENQDRSKLQTDIAALRDQIKTVVGSAQFNGLNLVNNSDTVNVLASLDRSSTGVTVSNIAVSGQDLSIGGYVAKAAFGASTDGVSGDSDSAGFTLDNTSGAGTIEIDAITFDEGDSISVTIGNKTATYTVSAADAASTTAADIIAVGLKGAIEGLGITGLLVDYDSGTPGTLALSTGDGTTDPAAAGDLTVAAQFKNAGSGGLAVLDTIDVSTGASALAALGNIEELLQTSIDAAANFGSAQKRIDIQNEFVTQLSDSLRAGIGVMVDADMEEASARLQALQVQQQLATQALSIANQAPQGILSLFR
ncbi:MAG: flagellin [Rhodobacteraceae bacterium]|nr:flagellin [Paracoccaceae bacterium]